MGRSRTKQIPRYARNDKSAEGKRRHGSKDPPLQLQSRFLAMLGMTNGGDGAEILAALGMTNEGRLTLGMTGWVELWRVPLGVAAQMAKGIDFHSFPQDWYAQRGFILLLKTSRVRLRQKCDEGLNERNWHRTRGLPGDGIQR